MRTFFSVLTCGLILLSDGAAAESWTLPRGVAVKDNAPRTYRFTVEYSTSDTQGHVLQRQIISGDYTRGLPGGDVIWRNVSQIDSKGGGEPSGSAKKREFMEGLRFHKDLTNSSGSMAPDFFRGFPPTAVFERNLVWDTEMIELFGQTQFEHLKLNQPYHFLSNQTVNMPGVGAFNNRDVQLIWMGRSARNGHECALIGYSAYFNPLEIENEAMSLKGRSHYWGQIWVALVGKQIEYATLYEDVLAEMKPAGQDTPQVVSVFRSGRFEPLSAK